MFYRVTFYHATEYWRVIQRNDVSMMLASCTVGRTLDWMLITHGIVKDAARVELIGQVPQMEVVEGVGA
jgi:hypothetical protein